MKKISKIMIILCIIFTIMSINVITYASAIDSAATLLSGLHGNVEVETSTLETVGNQIIATVRVVGIIISVGVLIILGIKYMTGSPEDKSDFKKSMIPYIVGAVLIFASTVVVGIIYDIAKSLNA